MLFFETWLPLRKEAKGRVLSPESLSIHNKYINIYLYCSSTLSVFVVFLQMESGSNIDEILTMFDDIQDELRKEGKEWRIKLSENDL